MKFYSLVALVAVASAVKIAPHEATNMQIQPHMHAKGQENWIDFRKAQENIRRAQEEFRRAREEFQRHKEELQRQREELERKAIEAKKWIHEKTA